MKYYIIAGEASGDLHASNLMKELKKLDTKAEFRCWGGDLMKEQGGFLVKHYQELAFMGFVEVLMNLRAIFKNIDLCKKDILEDNPDVLILVDYPGFNLRIAAFAKLKGFKVIYYISPQVWAWKENRVQKIKRVVDRMFVILPFEKDFYKKFDYKVDFVGHPLLDVIENKNTNKSSFEDFIRENDLSRKPIIAILPGSRKQEISKMLDVMLSIKDHYPSHQFVIAAAPSVNKAFYETHIHNKDVGIVANKTYNLLQHADAALVTSGTATLETALFEVPQVVCYSAGTISYYIARNLIKVKYISLVNLVMDKQIVKELIQNDFNAVLLKRELDKLIYDITYTGSLKNNYIDLKKKLGGRGASGKTAELITKYLSGTNL